MFPSPVGVRAGHPDGAAMTEMTSFIQLVRADRAQPSRLQPHRRSHIRHGGARWSQWRGRRNIAVASAQRPWSPGRPLRRRRRFDRCCAAICRSVCWRVCARNGCYLRAQCCDRDTQQCTRSNGGSARLFVGIRRPHLAGAVAGSRCAMGKMGIARDSEAA
jgi:hypothetical protein